jgi:hypothetical protein
MQRYETQRRDRPMACFRRGPELPFRSFGAALGVGPGCTAPARHRSVIAGCARSSRDRPGGHRTPGVAAPRQSRRLRVGTLLLGCQILIAALLSCANASALEALFEDEQACLICHKYPKMARITEEGARRSYYVMPEAFGGTVHRNVACGDCHNYIKQLPHREIEDGVTCDSECHSVENPATGKNFSHKGIMKVYQKSVHARTKVASGNDQDKPYCVTCHTNPLYNPDEAEPPKRIVDRCVICHEDRKFVVSWYKHTSRRIKEVKRSSEQIVGLCASCHGDQRLVQRHLKAAAEQGRELGRKYAIATESYRESFHGKITHYGSSKAANCLDCHADADNYFVSVHNIRPSRDPEAPTSDERRVETCKRCHTYADANYAALDPHPSSLYEDSQFSHYAERVYNAMAVIVIVIFVALALFETIGRRRDGVGWMIHRGSSWWRRSRRGRARVV